MGAGLRPWPARGGSTVSIIERRTTSRASSARGPLLATTTHASSSGYHATMHAKPRSSSLHAARTEELAQAKAELAKAQAKADGLQDLLDALDEDYDAMEAQRQLLLELRKDLPEARDDAQAYLDKIQRLANKADPSRLGQFASRMLETAPTFLSWRDEDFASPAERDAAFLTSGASGFTTDFTELKDAVLLSVANRLDAILSLRDRIR